MTAGPLTYEENMPVAFVPGVDGISDIAAPTEAEVGGGTQLASYIGKNGGVQFPDQQGMVDTSSIDRRFNSEYPGSEGGTLIVTFKRRNRDGDSAAWDLFKDPEVPGYLVFGLQGSNDDDGDEVIVYQVVGARGRLSNPDGDTEQRFVVRFGVQDWAQGVTVTDGS